MAAGLSSCVEQIPPVNEEIVLSRCLTPTDLVTSVKDGQYVNFTWTKTRGADSFVLEVYTSEDMGGTPVKTLTVLADDSLPAVAFLAPDVTYYARVKAVDSTGKMEDSHWAKFNPVETTAIKDPVDPQLVSRTAGSITLKWTADPEVDHIRIVPPIGDDKGFTKFTVSAAAAAAGQVEVTGLKGSTYYTLTVHYSSADRGSVSAWTLPDATGAVTVTDTAQFKQLIRDKAAKILVPYADTAFVIGSMDVSAPVTIMGQPSADGAFPTVVGSFKLIEGGTSVNLEGLRIDGQNYKYSHVITASIALSGLTVNVLNCEVTAFSRGLFYDNVGCTVPSFVADGLYVTDIQGSGGDFFDVRKSTAYGTVVFRNGTFDTGMRDFFRIDSAPVESFLFDHNTVNNVASTGSSNGFFRAKAGQVASYVVSNNLILNESGAGNNKLVNKPEYQIPAFQGNYFFNCGDAFFTDNKGNDIKAAAIEGGAVLPADPCVDSGINNFYVTNPVLLEKKVGDPRWLEEYVKIPEDLTQEVTAPVKTWNLKDAGIFYKSASEDMVRDGIRFYVKDKPVAFEADGFLFTDAATLEAGAPVDGGLGIKVSVPGSVVVSTGTAGDGSGMIVVNRNGKPVIGIPAGANAQMVSFEDIASEEMIYIYATGEAKLTSLQWTDELASAGGSKVLADPVPAVDVASVNEGADATVTVSWPAVDKAGKYGITLNGTDKGTVTDASYAIATKTLAPGTYTVGVKAMPADDDLVREASAEVTVQFAVKEILKTVLVETVWDSLYFHAAFDKFGADAVKADFVEKNLGYVNGSGSGFKYGRTPVKTEGNIYRCQLAGGGAFTDGKLTKCGMQIMVGGNGTLEIKASGSGDATRVLLVNGVEYAVDAIKEGDGQFGMSVITVPVTAASGDLVSWCSKSGGMNIYSVKWTPAASAPLVDETAINEAWMADYTDLTKYPAQTYSAPVTIEKVTYYAAEGSTIKWASNRMQFGGKPTLDTETYSGVPIPTGFRYASFKITKPGTVKVFFYSGGSSNGNRNGTVVLETNVGGTKSAKVVFTTNPDNLETDPGVPTSTSAEGGLKEIEIKASDLAGITEAAVLYFFSTNNTIQITKIGFTPAE